MQIYIEEDLYEALARESVRVKTSKAALIRLYVRGALKPSSADDPFGPLIGKYDGEPIDIDEVLYGPLGSEPR